MTSVQNTYDEYKFPYLVELLDKLLEDDINVLKYYNKVKKLVSFNLIDSITYEEVKRVSNFYNSKVFVKQMDEIKKHIKINRR